ncbi:MAG: hypothetical protein CMH83_19235 [Nocardioides sp.]|nr:hypothetical protein [Nocardioides sp.]
MTVLGGCGGTATDLATGDVRQHVATYEPTGGAGDALLPGTLVVTDYGCVLVQAGDTRVLPVFPADEVAWEDGALVFRDEQYADGDEVSFAGGESGPADEVEGAPAACTGEAETAWTVG